MPLLLRICVATTAFTLSLPRALAYDLPPFPTPPPEAVWSVVLEGSGSPSLKHGHVLGAAAWGSYNDAIHTTGWGLLDVHTSDALDGESQSYAAGFLEGALTHQRITDSLSNTWGIDFGTNAVGSIPRDVYDFVAANDKWMRAQITDHPKDDYWQMVRYLLVQRQGLADGYNSARADAAAAPLTDMDLYMLSLINADMDDLTVALKTQAAAKKNTAQKAVLNVSEALMLDANVEDHRDYDLRADRRKGHCSVLVQLAPDKSDLWVSHVTFDVYRNMLRIVKYLDMPLPGAATRRIAFSSFPGNLYSADGFHVTDAGLSVVETTIGNYNKNLWQLVAPESIMTWGRAMIANRLATDGDSWTKLQIRHNSGTCNNQWIIVDYKLFQPGQELQPGTLWISETMPGHAMRADVTGTILHQGSWPSYNVPYFADIFRAGGWEAMQKLHPDKADDFSYYECPRAKMFKQARQTKEVHSLDTFMRWMRRNKPADPLAKDDTCNAISARCDLNDKKSHVYDCFGAHDSKVTAWRGQDSAGNLSFYGVLSPTFDDQEPFSWTNQNSSVDTCRRDLHMGHPDTFNFGWHTFPAAVEGDEELGFAAVREIALEDALANAGHLRSAKSMHTSSYTVQAAFAFAGGFACVLMFVAVRLFWVREKQPVGYISVEG